MRYSSSLLVLAGVTSLSASSEDDNVLKKRGCQNGPKSRMCWGDFDIDTDDTTTWPNTGVTRFYDFNITEETLAPDGVKKPLMVVNGQYPGPAIIADWGDILSIQVCNQLTQNGTSIHFHGARQQNSNYADGAISQTACPLAPGDCTIYTWQATQHGSSWYHSHFSLQYASGVFGPLVINGPQTANWDIDLGPLLVNDYYHDTVWRLAVTNQTMTTGQPPDADNGLFNGKNKWNGGGAYHTLSFTSGKKHLIRLANTGSEAIFKFSVDQHKMIVVATDFIPIVPFEATSVSVAVGQRLDVIIDADQDSSKAYWARGLPMESCREVDNNYGHIRAVVRYDDSTSTEDPKSNSWSMTDECHDEPLSHLVPWIPHTVGPSSLTELYNASLAQISINNGTAQGFRWLVGGAQPFNGDMSQPVVKQLFDGTYPGDSFVPVNLTGMTTDSWVYMVVESSLDIPHPLHLHGHNVYVLARGNGSYSDAVGLTLDNPPRRDTVNLPPQGYVALAFKTDNPGAWFFHCHIEWHLNDGFALSVIERAESEISSIWGDQNTDEMRRICKSWEASGLQGLSTHSN
ncbi:putative laccase precursor [Podospora australis]|uniref:Laccase n=1 Tax=Podospora australis TaxID=1536484 RepID=A0AAN6WU62_9PEZI|nr:putative laccase precursor [Podospora australis]